MKIYVFGNPEVPEDRKALDVARELGDTVAGADAGADEGQCPVPDEQHRDDVHDPLRPHGAHLLISRWRAAFS